MFAKSEIIARGKEFMIGVQVAAEFQIGNTSSILAAMARINNSTSKTTIVFASQAADLVTLIQQTNTTDMLLHDNIWIFSESLAEAITLNEEMTQINTTLSINGFVFSALRYGEWNRRYLLKKYWGQQQTIQMHKEYISYAFDSVLLLANAVTTALSKGVNPYNGRALYREIISNGVLGASGYVSMDKSGDRGMFGLLIYNIPVTGTSYNMYNVFNGSFIRHLGSYSPDYGGTTTYKPLILPSGKVLTSHYTLAEVIKRL